MSVPIRVDAGTGSGGAALGVAGTGSAHYVGAPTWLVGSLLAATLLFTAYTVWRIGKRGGIKAPGVTAVILLAALGLGVGYASLPGAPVADAKRPAPAPADGIIGLSFDDGPSPELTPTILRVLRENNVKATFFVTGEQAKAYPALLREIAAEGHVIGNHSYAHPDFTDLSYEQARQSIEWTQNIIEGITGTAPVLFRYPYGNSSAAGDQAVRELGLYDVLWHWSQPGTGDFDCPGWKQVEKYATNQLADQAIILLHDGGDTVACGEKQVRYLDRLIDTARGAGYDFGIIQPADGPSPINQHSWVDVVAP